MLEQRVPQRNHDTSTPLLVLSTSCAPALQHLAEDADLVAAESGLASVPSSDGASFDSADTQPSTMRRRLTSAGIADAEGAPKLCRAARAVGLEIAP